MPPMAHFSNPSEDLATMWCDTRRLTRLHLPSQHQRLNNTSTSQPTAIKILLKWESMRMKTSTTMANHDPRMNRLSSCILFELPPNTARIRRSLVHDVPHVLDMIVWSVFLECASLPCACACFWLLGLKNPLVCKTRLGNLTKMCFPLTYLCQLE
jgi:hypothetical protein